MHYIHDDNFLKDVFLLFFRRLEQRVDFILVQNLIVLYCPSQTKFLGRIYRNTVRLSFC